MTVAPPFWRLQIHEMLPSTSTICRERAEAGEPEGLAVLARRQTRGRGRQGRGWESPVGNLYLSVLLRPAVPVAEIPQWGLLAAVSLADMLAPHIPDPDRLRLKWPNDVLLDGAKLAGLLAEAASGPTGRVEWLVIGIGVNLRVAPSLPDRATACLGPFAPAPEVFAARLLDRLGAWRSRVAGEGFAAVRAAWLARGPALGDPLHVRRGQERRGGCFAGLAEDGSLLLTAAGTVRVFAAGET